MNSASSPNGSKEEVGRNGTRRPAFVIGIAGGSGSGKSTISRKLVENVS